MNEKDDTLFNAAIVENGLITNVLVFDNEETMQEFGALRLAEGQGIGDQYMTPEEYAEKVAKERIMNYVEEVVNNV